MSEEYLYFQTIIQFRVPVNGGSPEVLKQFTTQIYGKNPTKKKQPKKLLFGNKEQISVEEI